MSKIVIEFEDTDDGQVAVSTTIAEFSETSKAAQMATRVCQSIDAIGKAHAGESLVTLANTPAIRDANGRKVRQKPTIILTH